jgi:hypothetical protein
MGIGDAINLVFREIVVKWLSLVSNSIPEEYKVYINLGLALISITLYGIFVWNFYRFLARRDLLELNLSQYNKTDNPGFYKFLAIVLFILEYIIILPIAVFFWFTVMASLIFVLAEDLQSNPEMILFISAAIIGAVRITAYYNEDLSRDMAKNIPFTILAIALITPGFFKIKTIQSLGHLGDLLPNLFFYLIVIIVIEFVLRMLYLISPAEDSEEEKSK